MTSNIKRDSENNYVINTDVTLDSLLTTSNIIPKDANKFSLGMDQNRFSNLYLNGNLLIGDVDVISQLSANSNFRYYKSK